MKNKKKNILLVLVAFLIFTSSIPVMAATIPNSGTERAFSTDIPFSYQNVYFTSRTKQSNYNIGYVYLTKLSAKCNGVTVWICDGSKNRCTNTVACRVLSSKYAITYSSNYGTGSTVRLGLEDLDNTQLLHHSVSGYVNYN